MSDLEKSIREVGDKRDGIWKTYDQAKQQGQRLEDEFSRKYYDANVDVILSPLTADNIPFEEVSAVIDELNRVDLEIENHMSEIRARKREIEDLKDKSKRLTLSLVGLGIFVVTIGLLYLHFQSRSSVSNRILPNYLVAEVSNRNI